MGLLLRVVRWRNGYSVELAINRSRVQVILGTTLHNNLGQVVHTYASVTNSSITWYRYDSVCSHWMSLQHGQNLHSGNLIKVIKMLHGHCVHAGKTLTDFQILGSELHQNAFG